MTIVDITEKPAIDRIAVAAGDLHLRPATLTAILEGRVEKGDVREAAKVASLQAVKDTPRILPHCHPIPLTGVKVHIDSRMEGNEAVLSLKVEVRALYRTGVEMEALTGVAAGLLTAWDMVKPLEKDEAGQYPTTRIGNVRVIEKSKGGSP